MVPQMQYDNKYGGTRGNFYVTKLIFLLVFQIVPRLFPDAGPSHDKEGRASGRYLMYQQQDGSSYYPIPY